MSSTVSEHPDFLQDGPSKIFDIGQSSKENRIGAHAMIYARTNRKGIHNQPLRAKVLMMFRDDGYISFPGGMVEKEESILDGLHREMKEEINLDLDKYVFRDQDHVVSHIHPRHTTYGDLELHFFALEVSEADFHKIESDMLQAEHYGIETFGLLRVPVTTDGPNNHGLPCFLTQRFMGNAREQLLYGLWKRGINTLEEIQTAWNVAAEMQQLRRTF